MSSYNYNEQHGVKCKRRYGDIHAIDKGRVYVYICTCAILSTPLES